MRGRVWALIALGAGFNPILTGREPKGWEARRTSNRRLAQRASRFGRSANQIDEKIDEIIDFAEIREFIDMPVQSYSSGMSVRLSFAVATAMNPDVLVWMRFSKPPRTFWKKFPSLPHAEKTELDIKMMANTD